VTRGALQIDAEEYLTDALSELHGNGLSGTDDAAPLDAAGKSLAVPRGSDQFPGEDVVWLVFPEGTVEPRCDLP
jgi:hypothetical protein